ncbi:hypothetical protein [Streptomyces sulphureus]|uniref:hypothetical protein n=1 Tax=Streptomyces sulphureus TaxID=47758 RepID=UPI00038026E3|nr:hypothetical protein [Streptomyces sulphureus]
MRTSAQTRVPEPTVRLFLTACGIIEVCCVLQHVGFGVLALTSPQDGGDSGTELLRVMTYCSPLLAVLSFCGAALAFSGRTARRRPSLAGASLLVVTLMCALLVAGACSS